MDKVEMICFEIISSVGTSRSCYVEAIKEARNGDLLKADELITEGNEMLRKGHAVHASLVRDEAEGRKTDISLLLIHAEDQMMSAETLGIVSKELIELYRNK